MTVSRTYVDEGISAYKNVYRPQFEQMIADVRAGKYPDAGSIVVYNTSRFSRRSSNFDIVEQELNHYGVDIISATQTFAKDGGGLMSKKLTTMFDEYHSIQTSANVKRAKREMVGQGHWSGGVLRCGFRLVPAENGRMRIEVDEGEETFVKKVFHLAEYGDGQGPMGIKAIVNWAQKNGFRARNGAPFATQNIHRILTFEGYKGTYPYGVNPTPGALNSPAEGLLYLSVRPIIEPDHFEHIQQFLEIRNPHTHAAKTVSSPLLLAGVVVCKCNGP
jgi:hypothetical protein